MEFIKQYLIEAKEVIDHLDLVAMESVVSIIEGTRGNNGRMFVLGVGGSAANASHAVNDFRKIAGIEAYAPTDNVSELTARTNDDGWASVFVGWLKTSGLCHKDMILGVFCWRWKSRQKCEPESRFCDPVRQGSGGKGLRCCGARWWVYSPGGRCLCYCSDCEPGAHNPAC